MVLGKLADSYLGRKRIILLSCLLTSITAFLSLSLNIWVYSFLRFSNGFACAGVDICYLVLSSEVVGQKWRSQVGQYGFFFSTLNFLSLPLIAYSTRSSWRLVYRVISLLPFFYSFLIIPFIFESPRWLAVKGRPEEAHKVLSKIARLDGQKLPTNLSISSTKDASMQPLAHYHYYY